MKKISFILAFMLLITSSGFAAQKNTDLLIDLNRGIVVFTKAKLQYESRQKQFRVQMPYMETVVGKAEQIKELKVVLEKLGGKADVIKEEQLIIEQAPSLEDALLLDAAEEIGAVAFCNLLIYKYNDPEVNKAATKIRDQSQYYYMMYDNIAQFSVMAVLRSKEMPASMFPQMPGGEEEQF
ncbi:MAG: hypothetical protein KKD05_03295 [Candidatus Omnitrophica bacterium]|nr:hypothetical protein [Candidatus Omnitrophota bacterium]